MSISGAISRGYHFFVVAFLGILGGSLISELSQEDEWLFKLDELCMIAIGVIAVVWYLAAGRKRQTLSWIPLLLAVLALASKIFGLIVEIKDPADVGDDIGIVQALLLFVIVAVVSYVLTRRQIWQVSAQETRSQVPVGTR